MCWTVYVEAGGSVIANKKYADDTKIVVYGNGVYVEEASGAVSMIVCKSVKHRDEVFRPIYYEVQRNDKIPFGLFVDVVSSSFKEGVPLITRLQYAVCILKSSIKAVVLPDLESIKDKLSRVDLVWIYCLIYCAWSNKNGDLLKRCVLVFVERARGEIDSFNGVIAHGLLVGQRDWSPMDQCHEGGIGFSELVKAFNVENISECRLAVDLWNKLVVPFVSKVGVSSQFSGWKTAMDEVPSNGGKGLSNAFWLMHGSCIKWPGREIDLTRVCACQASFFDRIIDDNEANDIARIIPDIEIPLSTLVEKLESLNFHHKLDRTRKVIDIVRDKILDSTDKNTGGWYVAYCRLYGKLMQDTCEIDDVLSLISAIARKQGPSLVHELEKFPEDTLPFDKMGGLISFAKSVLCGCDQPGDRSNDAVSKIMELVRTLSVDCQSACLCVMKGMSLIVAKPVPEQVAITPLLDVEHEIKSEISKRLGDDLKAVLDVWFVTLPGFIRTIVNEFDSEEVNKRVRDVLDVSGCAFPTGKWAECKRKWKAISETLSSWNPQVQRHAKYWYYAAYIRFILAAEDMSEDGMRSLFDKSPFDGLDDVPLACTMSLTIMVLRSGSLSSHNHRMLMCAIGSPFKGNPFERMEHLATTVPSSTDRCPS